MMPAVLLHRNHFHDYGTQVLKRTGGSYMFKGPLFANMDMLFCTDPADVHHILSKNFQNYPKGRDFRRMFDVLGDGIFSADNELWELHRRTSMSLFKLPEFQTLLEASLWDKVEKRLLPVLEHVSRRGVETDMQDIFQRFSFDFSCSLFLDYNPGSLSVDFPYTPCMKAFSEMEEALLYRHIVPESLWGVIGNRKKMTSAGKTFNRFFYDRIAEKRANGISTSSQVGRFELMTALMKQLKDQTGTSSDPNKFLRDTLVGLVAAGSDTTGAALSWFFYLVATHPTVEEKIREEIRSKLGVKAGDNLMHLGAKDLRKLVYLHGALCETMRLYPSVPFQRKSPLQADVLPSGHHVDEKSKIILCFYSMGRMEWIWGEDCMEFKPERWLDDSGRIKHEPSYKFVAFNAGPRTCIGKEIGLTQLKIVATAVIHNYHVEMVKPRSVLPRNSLILEMKHGLKVRLHRNGYGFR